MSLLLVVLLLIASETAGGEGARPVVGATALQARAPQFQGTPCRRWLSMFKGAKHAHGAVLWDPKTFGGHKQCLRRFAKLPNPEKSLEIHPTCGPCRANPLLGYQTRPGSYLKGIRAFCERTGLRCLLSTELERRQSQRKAYEKIRREWPFELVDNPIPSFRPRAADYHELHGEERARPDTARLRAIGLIGDLDGTQLDFAAARKWIADRQHYSFLRLWRCGWQGVCDGNPPFHRRRFDIPRRDALEVNAIILENEHEKETR